jgi:uncharacterized damage-inducible protein DinB
MSPRKPPGRKKAAAGRKKTTTGARGSAQKKSATPGRTRLRVVTRRTPRRHPAPPPAFPQAQSGTGRQKLLFELVRARVGVHAAVQGLVPASAEQPTQHRGWSVRQHVLHLHATDRAVLRSIEGALLGHTPEWTLLPPDQRETFEQDGVVPFLHLDWAEALRRLHAGRDQLMEALESVPDEPASVWEQGHPFAELLALVIAGDREHAEAIKRWRTTREPG